MYDPENMAMMFSLSPCWGYNTIGGLHLLTASGSLLGAIGKLGGGKAKAKGREGRKKRLAVAGSGGAAGGVGGVGGAGGAAGEQSITCE
jgi:hypothetical protein|eukprot:evm.model.NODE_6270_length_5998_cov_24.269590.1